MAGLGTNMTAAQAFARFGLGGRPDDIVPTAPVSWLFNQLQIGDPTPVAGLSTTADNLILAARAAGSPPGSGLGGKFIALINTLFAKEVQIFLANAVTTGAPFRERLVWFWANHLAIMAGTVFTVATAGSYVREAIRPNVTGRYTDLLTAAILHPAMLYSLNNDTSMGPDSAFAIKFKPFGRNWGSTKIWRVKRWSFIPWGRSRATPRPMSTA